MIDIPVGLGPQQLEGPGSASAGLGAFAFEFFQTPLLDLTKTYSNIELIPARPGFIPISSTNVEKWVIELVQGTQTSPPTVRAGSDAAHTNFINNQNNTPSNAIVNTTVPPAVTIGNNLNFVLPVQSLPGVPVFFDLVSPAQGTGGYIVKARYVCGIAWVPVG